MVRDAPQNLDRFVSFYKAAVNAGRTFVCDHYQAAVLYQLRSSKLPKPTRAGSLRVYLPGRRAPIKAYESHIGGAEIELAAVLAAPESHMMLVRPSIILDDLKGHIPTGTILLYGLWSGYRCKPEWQQAEQAISEAGSDVIECHASGHAHGDALFTFVEDLNPAKILPIHTRATEAFKDHFGLLCETEIVVVV